MNHAQLIQMRTDAFFGENRGYPRTFRGCIRRAMDAVANVELADETDATETNERGEVR